MKKANHGEITEDAFKNAGLREKALHLIIRANQDSDHVHCNLHDGRQHFQGKRTETVIEDSMDFCNSATDMAATLAAIGTDAALTMALYFMGRVFHCIQDFYAHSNWIAIGERCTFDFHHWPANLFFCWETPGGFFGKFDNYRWFYPQPPDQGPYLEGMKTEPGERPPTMLYRQFKGTKNTEAKQNSMALTFDRLQSRPLYHPEAHLDCEGSWASECIRAYRDDGWAESGYRTAAHLAALHTKAQWEVFMGDVEDLTLFEEAPELTKTELYTSIEKMMKKHDLRPKHVARRVGRSIEDKIRKVLGKSAKDRRKVVTEFDPGTIPWILMAKLRSKFNEALDIGPKGLWVVFSGLPAI